MLATTSFSAATTIGDAISHPDHYGGLFGEALATGAIAFVLALVASYLFEDRARRLRDAWARLSGRTPAPRDDRPS